MQFPEVLLLTSSFPPIQLEEEKDEDSFDMDIAVTNPEKIGKEYFFLTNFELMFCHLEALEVCIVVESMEAMM